MGIQTTLNNQELINRCYVIWNHTQKGKWEEKPIVIIFKEPHNKKPFHKQKPQEILTEEELETKYKIRLKRRGENGDKRR